MAYPATYTPEPTKPSGGPAKGTKILYAFILLHFTVKGLGIYNPRDTAGNMWPNWRTGRDGKKRGSQHASGRAGDCGVAVDRKRWPTGHPEGRRLAAWLVRWHLTLGIQEVIFADRRWTNKLGVIPWSEWPRYDGRSDHFDHVHWAQNAEGAAGLTLAVLEALWAEHPPLIERAVPTPQQSKEDDMAVNIKGKNTPEWWAATAHGKRHMQTAGHAAELVRLGLLDQARPQEVADSMIAELPTIPNDPIPGKP